MADFVATNEGMQYLATTGQGLPSTCYFALSTNSVNAGTITATTTLTGGIGEATGTGYARQSQAAPTPSGTTISFSLMTWSTSSATNWPSSTIAVILVTVSTGTTGKTICAWDLETGGSAVNLSAASTTLQVTPTLVL